MTDATEYGVVSQDDNYILNNNPPGVTKDYVKDNEDKMAEEIMSEGEQHEPSIAPGMNMEDDLEKKANQEEIEHGESTSVTRLYLDRTPED